MTCNRPPRSSVLVLLAAALGCGQPAGPSGPAGDVTTDSAPDAAPDGDAVERVDLVDLVDLVDHDLWRLTADEDDPFGHERPAEVTCPEDAWYIDEGVVEVDTERCNYVTLEQPLGADVEAGDRLAIVAWSGRLASPDGDTEGHIAVTLGAELLWEARVAIPSAGYFFTPTVIAPIDAPRGSAVRFHIHNHGFNTWNLVSLRRTR